MTFENHPSTGEEIQSKDIFGIERVYETIETRKQRGSDYEETLDLPNTSAPYRMRAALEFIEASLEQGTEAELDLEHVLYQFTTLLHRRLSRLELEHGDIKAVVDDQLSYSDTSEVGTALLESNVDRAKRMRRRIKHLECLRDVSSAYLAEQMGTLWIAPKGTAPVISQVTAGQLSARAYLQAQKARRLEKLAPDGPVFAVVGPHDFPEITIVEHELNRLHREHPDLVVTHFAHTESRFDNAVAMWCRRNNVTQIPMNPPDWKKDKRAAPYRRNDKMLDLGLEGVVVFHRPEKQEPHGISLNVADKANEQRPPVPVRRIHP